MADSTALHRPARQTYDPLYPLLTGLADKLVRCLVRLRHAVAPHPHRYFDRAPTARYRGGFFGAGLDDTTAKNGTPRRPCFDGTALTASI